MIVTKSIVLISTTNVKRFENASKQIEVSFEKIQIRRFESTSKKTIKKVLEVLKKKFKRKRLNKNKSKWKVTKKLSQEKTTNLIKALGNVPTIVISLREDVDDGI